MIQKLLNLFNETFSKVVSWALQSAPFIAIGAYLAVQWMRSKNAVLDAKIRKLETEMQGAKNAQAIEDKFSGKSGSAIIDHAVDRGSKMPE